MTAGNEVGAAGATVGGEVTGVGVEDAAVGAAGNVTEVAAVVGGAVEGDSVMEASVPDILPPLQEHVPAKVQDKKINSTSASLLFTLLILRRHSFDFPPDFLAYFARRKNHGRAPERQQVA